MPPANEMSLRALNRATLARQYLLARTKEKIPKVVSHLVGLQAQWPKPPFVGLASRIEGFTPKGLNKLFHDRSLIRATLWRGTLHVVTPADYADQRLLVEAQLVKAMVTGLGDRSKGLDIAATVRQAKKILAKGALTFSEIRERLIEAFPKVNDRALGYCVRMTIPLVMVPTDARFSFPQDAAFADAERWIDRPVRRLGKNGVATKADLDALVLRYLAAFGPATAADAQIWSGVPALKESFSRLATPIGKKPAQLIRFRFGRQELFDLRDAPRPDEETEAPVRILAEYDNLLLAHKDRSRIVATAHKKKVFLPGLRVAGTFLVDGMVAGTWRIIREKKVAVLVLEPFSKLAKKDVQALEQEAKPVLQWLDSEARTLDVRLLSPSA